MPKFIGEVGVKRLWNKISEQFVQKEVGKGLSTNDYTNTDKAEVAKVKDKVDINNVLTKDNTTEYTPSADYNPATKKYVDDNMGASSSVSDVYVLRVSAKDPLSSFTICTLNDKLSCDDLSVYTVTVLPDNAASSGYSGTAVVIDESNTNQIVLSNITSGNYITIMLGSITSSSNSHIMKYNIGRNSSDPTKYTLGVTKDTAGTSMGMTLIFSKSDHTFSV